MRHIHYQKEALFVEQVAVADIAARYGTPCYIYSRAAIQHNFQAFDQAFAKHPHKICYAVKANSNIAVLDVLAQLGAGFDIVSVGEMQRVLATGCSADRIIFSGVGKREDEIIAALKAGIHCFNIEVGEELQMINNLAAGLGVVAGISLRVNPDVDAKTHPYISTGLRENKFGIDINQAHRYYIRASKMSNIKILGVDCHIGSQLTDTAPFLQALDKILVLLARLQKSAITLQNINLGGGLGIRYQDESPPTPANYIAAILQRLCGNDYEITLEPGRSIVGNAGIFVSKTLFLKPTAQKNFAIVDGAMNDLLRPTLYGAWQDIIPIEQNSTAAAKVWDIVGPVCETSDFLGKQRTLRLAKGDLLAVMAAGAYGFCMASNYNSRPRPAEIMVDGDQAHLIRQRETTQSLWQAEQLLPQTKK